MTAPASPRPVVIVDDDVDHALIVRLVLGQVAPGAPVDVMTDPRQLSSRLFAAPEGALVFLDRNLDGTDGIALLPLLAAERPDLRTVLLSASLGELERTRALAAGAWAAVEKPSSVAGWRALLASVHAGPASEASRAA